jgi:hypothetical protein
VLNRDRLEQKDRHAYQERQRFSGAGHERMRKPQANASTAFQKNRHPSRDADDATAHRHQPDLNDRRQSIETEVAAPAPHSRSIWNGAAPESSSAVASAEGVNFSAAAQLRARLRGLPVAELATASRDVCHPQLCLMGYRELTRSHHFTIGSQPKELLCS